MKAFSKFGISSVHVGILRREPEDTGSRPGFVTTNMSSGESLPVLRGPVRTAFLSRPHRTGKTSATEECADGYVSSSRI